MKDRLIALSALIEELKSESFAHQYGIADFVEHDTTLNSLMNELAKESQFYQKVLLEINQLKNTAKGRTLK